MSSWMCPGSLNPTGQISQGWKVLCKYGRKSQLTMNPAKYNNNWSGNECPLVQQWQGRQGSNHFLTGLHKTELMPGTVN